MSTKNSTKWLIVIGVVLIVIGIIVIGTVGAAAILAYFIYSNEQTSTSGSGAPSVMHQATNNNIATSVVRVSNDEIKITYLGGPGAAQLQSDDFGAFTIKVNGEDCSQDGLTDTITVTPAEGLSREVGSQVTLKGTGVNPTGSKGVPVVITAHYLHTFDATIFSGTV
jgi:hypothetical protein